MRDLNRSLAHVRAEDPAPVCCYPQKERTMTDPRTNFLDLSLDGNDRRREWHFWH